MRSRTIYGAQTIAAQCRSSRGNCIGCDAFIPDVETQPRKDVHSHDRPNPDQHVAVRHFVAARGLGSTRQRNALTLGYVTAPLLQTSLLPAGIKTLVLAEPYGRYDYKASTSFNGDEGRRLDH